MTRQIGHFLHFSQHVLQQIGKQLASHQKKKVIDWALHEERVLKNQVHQCDKNKNLKKKKKLPAKDTMPTWKQDHANLSLKANPT